MIFNTKLMSKWWVMLVLLPAFALCVACGDDPTGNDDPAGEDDPTEEPGTKPDEKPDEEYEDIKVVGGKVRFYLKEKENSTRTSTGLSKRDWAKSNVIVNGKSYGVLLTDEETPRPYVEVNESGSYSATLVTSESNKWYGSSTYSDIKLPYSQFRHTAANTIKSFPMYASYSKETGNKLIFNDGFALVMLKLKGSAKISSVKVENPAGGVIAGISNFIPSKGYYTINKGMNFAVLNCTNNGDFVKLSSSKATNFWVMVAAGNYSQGLKITICDSGHLAMFCTTEAINLKAGDVHVIEKDYSPDADLAFFEGFDNFVWGGDLMNGEEGIGFAPTADKMGIESGMDLTGYEDAFTEVTYDNPGTGFIQSNTWADVNGKTVGESHQMSESYIKSRNIVDVRCMFRTQEHPGYIAVGAGNTFRGILTTPRALGMKSIGQMKVTIRFALQVGFTGNLLTNAVDGGVITAATLNGKAIELSESNLKYETVSSILTTPNKTLVIPSKIADKKDWNTLELIINGATSGTCIYIADESSSSGVHGVYIDSIEARQIDEWGKKDGTLRVMLWNILCGMWCDQHNNYDNFVAWVKKYDPDVCIWCESESLYHDAPAVSSLKEGEKFLPNGWASLCTRYGHTYTAIGGNRDGFPQTVTSKYKISTVKRITDTDKSGKPVSHGAGHFTIEVNGKKINIVTLHMWPQGYAYGVNGTANQEADKANNGGDYYRQHEMQYIVNNTVNLPANAGEELWIFGGDTNARSRHDSWYYSYAQDSPAYLTHDVVLNQTNLKDAISDYYPRNYFMSSTYASARIDILYLSPKMFDRIENSIMLIDDWNAPHKDGNVRDYYAPSDHRPVLIDFNMN